MASEETVRIAEGQSVDDQNAPHTATKTTIIHSDEGEAPIVVSEAVKLQNKLIHQPEVNVDEAIDDSPNTGHKHQELDVAGQKTSTDNGHVTSPFPHREPAAEASQTGELDGATDYKPSETVVKSSTVSSTSDDKPKPLESATQSQLDRESNFREAAENVHEKMHNKDAVLDKDDVSHLHSREVRAHGDVGKDSVTAEAQRQLSQNEGASLKKLSAQPEKANSQQAQEEGKKKLESSIASLSPAKDSHLQSHETSLQGGVDNNGIKTGAQRKLATANVDDRKDNTTKNAEAEAEFRHVVEIIKPKMDNDPKSVNKEDAQLLQVYEQAARGSVAKGGMTAVAMHLADENVKEHHDTQV